jgi:adenine-specific DNA-methyltransferase
MSDKLTKFKEVLREVFQMDQADLDFGIYRIMNQKRDEIEKFLDRDLLPQVKQLLEQNKSDDSKSVKDELDKAVENAKSIGVDPNAVPKVRDLQERYSAQADTSAMENEVFSHLANFFRRYYDNGDFISQRRYKKDVYAIPYEGEEVKLYWANYDQYYIKTTEYFKHYSFKLINGKKVNFVVLEATTEQNNNRAANAKERRFYLADETPVSVENDELNIHFHYDLKDAKQKDLNSSALEKVKLSFTNNQQLANFVGIFDIRRTEKNPNRTLLEKHINDYTARNTFDYFIHKDLGGFLRRELDFYIKNEVLYIDDINELDEKQFHKQVSSIKVIKQVGHKVIAFLEQLENFQKKLWLKKKFVVETNYCITLDRVPRELWTEVIANSAQIEEWKKLFAINEIEGDLERQAYTEALTERFLEQNQFLVLDTAFFSEEFKTKLLKSINGLDEQINGIMINGDNYQALSLLLNRYIGQVKCSYIDPPYNTNASEILYKNDLKHSSWLGLIENRLSLAKMLLCDNGITCITIDHVEFHQLRYLISQVFDENNILGLITIKNNPSGRSTVKGVSIANEFAIIVANSENVKVGTLPRNETQLSQYSEEDGEGNFQWRSFLRSGGSNDFRHARPKLFYPLFVKDGIIRIPETEWDNIHKEFHLLEQPLEDEKVYYPISNGVEYSWRLGLDTLKLRLNDLRYRVSRNNTDILEIKFRLDEDGVLPKTIWDDKLYNATSYGTTLLRNIFGEAQIFSFPKSIHAVVDSLRICNLGDQESALDYFAGSGTTGHAVINLNREDGGNRKYILVEMGEYFDTVTKPRIQKVVYSKDWRDGKPVSREGISHCFKYFRLESYEDTLNNLEVSRSQSQQQTLDINERFREGYMLSYMLDVETEGSSSLLNIDKFDDPFNYYLNITRNSETKATKVDLVETFNYLIGLVVETIDELDGYRVVTGKNLAGEKIFIIWRNLAQKSNEDLNAFFGRIRVNIHDSEFDRIYVNGDNFLENMKLEEDKWKVVLLEEEFKKRMFEATE